MDEDDYSPRIRASKTVLIYDPNSENCSTLSSLFRLEGYRTLATDDTDTLIALARGGYPDAMFISTAVRVPSGASFISTMKRDYPFAAVFGLLDTFDSGQIMDAGRTGATDVFLKPFDGEAMLQAVRNALGPMLSVKSGASKLTPRERQVLDLLLTSASNKEAGLALGISPRTVEIHRAKVMKKLGARNAVDLALRASVRR